MVNYCCTTLLSCLFSTPLLLIDLVGYRIFFLSKSIVRGGRNKAWSNTQLLLLPGIDISMCYWNGMLSGMSKYASLKNPSQSIPRGTFWAIITVSTAVIFLSLLFLIRHDAIWTYTFHTSLKVLSLAMDGIMAGCQSTLKRQSSSYRTPSAMDTMLWLNVYATIVLLVASHYTGQLQLGMDMIFSKNRTYIWLLFQLNLSASLGQVFIFLTIHHFSPLTTTTITTTRKFFTILLSVYQFGHVLDIYQWFSIGLVFAGLYLGIAAKLIESKQHADDEKKKIE